MIKVKLSDVLEYYVKRSTQGQSPLPPPLCRIKYYV